MGNDDKLEECETIQHDEKLVESDASCSAKLRKPYLGGARGSRCIKKARQRLHRPEEEARLNRLARPPEQSQASILEHGKMPTLTTPLMTLKLFESLEVLGLLRPQAWAQLDDADDCLPDLEESQDIDSDSTSHAWGGDAEEEDPDWTPGPEEPRAPVQDAGENRAVLQEPDPQPPPVYGPTQLRDLATEADDSNVGQRGRTRQASIPGLPSWNRSLYDHVAA